MLEDLGTKIAEDRDLSFDVSLSVQDTSLRQEPFPHIQMLLAYDLTMRLQAIAELPFRGYDPIQQAFARALKDFDTMAIMSLNHDMNRREALSRVIGFPFTAFAFTTVERGEKVPTRACHRGLALPLCNGDRSLLGNLSQL